MTFGTKISPLLPLCRWAVLIAVGAPVLLGEEMREIAPGSRQGRKEIQAADQIRPPLLERLGSFDLRSGRVPSAAPDPGPVPSSSGELSPAQRKKALDLLDRRRNWLIENAATLHRMERDGGDGGIDPEAEDTLNPGMTRSLQRLLEATERPGVDDPRRQSAGKTPRQGMESSNADSGESEGPGNPSRRPDVGVRLIPEDGLAESGPSTGAGITPDRYSPEPAFGLSDRRAGTGLFPDQRRDLRDEDPALAALNTRRAGAFEEILTTRTDDRGTGPWEGASALFGRSSGARSSAFQTLLQSPDWSTGPGPVGPSLFAPPTGPVGAPAARPIDLPTANRAALPAAFAPAVAAPRPAAPRIETRPLVLPVPTRSAF